MPGNVLGPGSTAGNQSSQVSARTELILLEELDKQTTIKHYKAWDNDRELF